MGANLFLGDFYLLFSINYPLFLYIDFLEIEIIYHHHQFELNLENLYMLN